MYRKYVLDRLDTQQQHLPSPPVANTFPDNHLIVGEAQCKAARAGALHRRDSGARVAESGTYRSDRSDSGIESEFGGSKTLSGQKNDPRASYSKGSAGQDKGDYKVELKSHRDWAPYKKPDRVKSEPDIIKNKSVKEKGESESQCTLETPSNSNDAADFITDPHGESRISRISSFSEGYIESKAEKRPPRHIRYNYSEVDLFDDFVSRDSTPEFRRPPKEITVRDIEQGISQRVALSSKLEHKESKSPSPVRLLDAHGCHDVKQELIVAKPIAEAAKGKPQSPMLFQNRRSDGFSRASVESVRPTHFPSGHSYASAKDAGKVLPVKDLGKGKRSHLDARNETVGPKKLSPRYSNHLQGEHPWAQTAYKGKLSERQLQPFETSSVKPGTPVPSRSAAGCYSSLCCNKGSIAKR
ncbi:uncharacterized protein [Macrobrachium rosenbergii]|uniref:uncharacterized protein n=1 Tax=Macrobrachium rosenbergii TaxID=79674 RepID=UPI0034D5F6E7